MLGLLVAALGLMDITAPPPPPPPKPKLICREDEQLVGSHIHTGRRCQTLEQWRDEDARRGQLPTTLHVVPDQGDGAPRPKRQPV